MLSLQPPTSRQTVVGRQLADERTFRLCLVGNGGMKTSVSMVGMSFANHQPTVRYGSGAHVLTLTAATNMERRHYQSVNSSCCTYASLVASAAYYDWYERQQVTFSNPHKDVSP